MADTTTTEQIVREAPDIEQYKTGLLGSAKSLVDAANLNALYGNYLTPDYEVAGMSPDQLAALQMGRQGIGAYQPYMTAAGRDVTAGGSTLGEAADVLRGADTRGQFAAAQSALNQSVLPMQQMGQAAGLAGAGIPLIGQGAQGLSNAQQLALASTFQPGYQQGIGALFDAAAQARQASQLGAAPTAQSAQLQGPMGVGAQQVSPGAIQAAQTGYNPNIQAYQMGPAAQVSTGSITAPGTLQQYMSPYQQAVTDISLREAQRQADIARQSRGAAAARSGAFGGGRQAVEEAEAARNLAQLKSDIQTKGLQEAFGAGQQQFNVEQQAGLAAQQANQQAGLTVGQQNLAAQQGAQQLQTQTGLQTALANLTNAQQAAVQTEANRLQASGMNQQAALQAALANQQVGYNTALQNAQLQQQTNLANQAMQGQYGLAGSQYGLQAAQQLAAAGSGQIGATAQEQGAQQSAANLYGNLAGQQAGLAGLYGNLAGQQANIYGQQSQLGQALGQGIGNLAAQQFGIGSQMAQGLGSLGTQQSNIGMQQAALGQQAQGLGQQDVNFLYNLGASQQKQLQSELDAERQNTLQQNMQPYQQLGFLSDIYKGAPSSSMGVTTQAAPAASPFQQAAGLGIAGVSAAAAAGKAGLI